MLNSFEYTIIVEQQSETRYVAGFRDVEDPTALQGIAETPLQAVRALCEQIREWPIGGAHRWRQTEAGKNIIRAMACDPFEPNMGRPIKSPTS